jgi:hypothetical protein
MIIKNVTDKTLIFSVKVPGSNSDYIVLNPNETFLLFDEDVVRQPAILKAIADGYLTVTSTEEPYQCSTGVCLTGYFKDLKDGPGNYCCAAGKAVIVNSCETGLDYAVFAGSDEKVAITSGDTPGYLENKLISGSGITLTTCGTTNKSLEVSLASSENLWDRTCNCVVPHTACDCIVTSGDIAGANLTLSGTASYTTCPVLSSDTQLTHKKYVDDCMQTANEFIELTDTPATYDSCAGCFVAVKSTCDGLEFVAHSKDTHDSMGLDHACLSNVTADQHHPQLHDFDSGSDHCGALSWSNVNKTGSNLTDIETRAHNDLCNIGVNDHHNQLHDLASASDHCGTLAWGCVDKSGSSILDLASVCHCLLSNLGDDDHTQYSLADGNRNYSGVVAYCGCLDLCTDTDLTYKKWVVDCINCCVVVENNWDRCGTCGYVSPSCATDYVLAPTLRFTDCASRLQGLFYDPTSTGTTLCSHGLMRITAYGNSAQVCLCSASGDIHLCTGSPSGSDIGLHAQRVINLCTSSGGINLCTGSGCPICLISVSGPIALYGGVYGTTACVCSGHGCPALRAYGHIYAMADSSYCPTNIIASGNICAMALAPGGHGIGMQSDGIISYSASPLPTFRVTASNNVVQWSDGSNVCYCANIANGAYLLGLNAGVSGSLLKAVKTAMDGAWGACGIFTVNASNDVVCWSDGSDIGYCANVAQGAYPLGADSGTSGSLLEAIKTAMNGAASGACFYIAYDTCTCLVTFTTDGCFNALWLGSTSCSIGSLIGFTLDCEGQSSTYTGDTAIAVPATFTIVYNPSTKFITFTTDGCFNTFPLGSTSCSIGSLIGASVDLASPSNSYVSNTQVEIASFTQDAHIVDKAYVDTANWSRVTGSYLNYLSPTTAGDGVCTCVSSSCNALLVCNSGTGRAIFACNVRNTALYAATSECTAICAVAACNMGIVGTTADCFGVVGCATCCIGVYGCAQCNVGVYGLAQYNLGGCFEVSTAGTSGIGVCIAVPSGCGCQTLQMNGYAGYTGCFVLNNDTDLVYKKWVIDCISGCFTSGACGSFISCDGCTVTVCQGLIVCIA